MAGIADQLKRIADSLEKIAEDGVTLHADESDMEAIRELTGVLASLHEVGSVVRPLTVRVE